MSEFAMFMVSIAAAAALAVPSEPPLPSVGPSTFDVAGTRLGMAPEAARLALKKAGYVVQRTSDTSSFKDQVASEVASRRGRIFGGEGRSLATVEAIGPNHERLTLTFEQWPAGPRLATVSLSVPEDRQSADDFQAQVERKYGPRSIGLAARSDQWCTVGDPKCTLTGRPELPSLSASYLGRLLKLQQGRSVERTREGAIKAAVDAEVPPVRRTTF